MIEVQDLSEILDGIVSKYGSSYMEAAIHYCEENNIEIETIGKALRANPRLISNIQIEAEDLHYLPKTSRL